MMHPAQRPIGLGRAEDHGMITGTKRAVRDGRGGESVRLAVRRARRITDEAAADVTMNGRHCTR